MSSPAETFLRGFHDAHPGATSSSLGWGRLPSGQSSYQHLAEVVPRSDAPITVLDLACGDGHLFDAVRARAPRCRYVGVDIAERDLAIARARCTGTEVAFRCERAQSLSAATGSVDVVVSHMALMLMDELDAVLGEAGRVLAAGGRFGATIGGGFRDDDAFGLFVELCRELSDSERELHLGDARLRRGGDLDALFGAAGFASVAVDDQPLALHGDVERVWSSLALTYDVAFLAPEARRELERRFRARAPSLADADGRVPFTLTLRRITAERRAD